MSLKKPNEIKIIICLAVIVALGLLTVALLNFLASIAMTVISITACITIVAGITKIIILKKEGENLRSEIEELKNPKQETNSCEKQIMQNKNAYDATKDNLDAPFGTSASTTNDKEEYLKYIQTILSDIKNIMGGYIRNLETYEPLEYLKNLKNGLYELIKESTPSFILNFSFCAQINTQNQMQQS